MKEEQDDLARSRTHPRPDIGSNPFDKDTSPGPRFGGYDRDRDEDLEEPERDTNFAAGFHESPADEDEAFEALLPDDLDDDDEALFEEQTDFLRAETGVREPDFADDLPGEEPRLGAIGREDELAEDPDWEDSEPATSWREDDIEEDAVPRQWAEEDYDDEEAREGWPLGLIAIGGLALLLVIAGAWGVIQQRSATQDEITQLRAQLATAASPEEVATSRAALQDMRDENAGLRASLDALRLENAGLQRTVAELDAQVAAQQGAPADEPAASAADSGPASAPAPAPVAKPAAKPAPAAPAAADAGGDWFVNFSSYSRRDTAREWADKLAPAAGKVVVTEGSRDGAVFYRVRIVGLADKAAAEAVAGQLADTYGLPKLWVGRE